MAEAASAALRRLHEEATQESVLPAMAADRTIRRALPEIAALVASVEREYAGYDDDTDDMSRALAALRAKLGVGR